MLDASNRQALTQQLRPPAGFRLAHAVGTTFTLDMTSALSVPLSFVAGSGEQFTNSVAVLTALRKVSDRVDIFCQAGQIRAPRDASDLLALLEPMVHQVNVSRGGLFHPKVWVLEFENEDDGKRRYRFLCSSRNLTPDTSWDLMVRLDGVPIDSEQPGNVPLSGFLKALLPMASVPLGQPRTTRIEALADRLANVQWELPEHISSLAFRPLLGGHGRHGNRFEPDSLVSFLRNPQDAVGLNSETGGRKTIGTTKLVISPFVDDTLLGRLMDPGTSKAHIFSRADQLDLLPTERVANRRMEFHSFDDSVSPELSDGSFDDLTGLHAKAFFCDYGFHTHALLGSSNATDAGFNRNVEFLVELRGKKSRIGVEKILKSLEDVPFINYAGVGGQSRSDEDNLRFQLEQTLRQAAAGCFVLDAVEERGTDAKGLYQVSVKHDWAPPQHLQATLRLVTLSSPEFPVTGPVVGNNTHIFRRVPLADVTPYLVLTVKELESGMLVSTVVQGHLRTDPDGRIDQVIARQLNDPDKLRQFLFLFLTPESAPPGSDTEGLSWRFVPGYSSGSSAGLFEALIAALENPNATDIFSDLEPVINRLLDSSDESDDIHQLRTLWKAAVETLQVNEVSHGL